MGNAELWDSIVCSVAFSVVLQKFGKTSWMMDVLLAEKGLFAEMTRNDNYWGTGINRGDIEAKDPSKWKGANILGWALTELRDAFKEGKYLEHFEDLIAAQDAEILSGMMCNQHGEKPQKLAGGKDATRLYNDVRSEEYRTYEVSIVNGKAKLGVEFDVETFCITGIKGGSLLGEHNKANPEQCVSVGHRILDVNGVKISEADDFHTTIDSNDIVTLKLGVADGHAEALPEVDQAQTKRWGRRQAL